MRLTRIAITATVVVTTAALLSAPARALPAAGPTATSATEATATARPVPAKLAGTASIDGCAAVAEAQRLSPSKQEFTGVCLTPLPADASTRPDTRASLAFQPMPSWCGSYPAGSWWNYRTEACLMRNWQISVEKWVNGQRTVVGYIRFWELSYSYTSYSIGTWAQQMQISVYQSAGDVAGLTIQGSASCSGSCTMGNVYFAPQSALSGQPGGEAYFHSTSTGPGAVGTVNTSINWYFSKPGALSSGTMSAWPPQVRCDNATPGIGEGCVFPNFTPVLIYGLGGPYPELAAHIRDAQASGLPGGYPSGSPLYRLVDAGLQQANRDTACPSSYPRPDGKSCDEYPFASTWQGAYTGGGQPRTFGWCEVSPPGPYSTGSSGYSVCMINDWQNSAGGSALGTFYSQNRVLHWDAFQVWIQ